MIETGHLLPGCSNQSFGASLCGLRLCLVWDLKKGDKKQNNVILSRSMENLCFLF